MAKSKPFGNLNRLKYALGKNLFVSPVLGFIAGFCLPLEHLIGSFFLGPFMPNIAITTGLTWFAAGMLGLTALAEVGLRLKGRGDDLKDNFKLLQYVAYAAVLHFGYYGMLEAGYKLGTAAIAGGALTAAWHYIYEATSAFMHPVFKSSPLKPVQPQADDEPEPDSPKPKNANKPSPKARVESPSASADVSPQARVAPKRTISPQLAAQRQASPAAIGVKPNGHSNSVSFDSSDSPKPRKKLF